MDSSNEKGVEWEMLDFLEANSSMARSLVQALREAMHDRDRFQRDAAWLRENAGRS